MANKNFKVKTGLDLPAPLPVEMGGTGQTTTSNTLNAILPIQTDNNGKYLSTDGTSTAWSSVPTPLAQISEPSSPTDGLIWVDTDGFAAGQQVIRWYQLPASGTTVLSGLDQNSLPLSYTPGYELVFINGTLISRYSDYTATDGSTVTLSTATNTGDIIEIFGTQSIATADVYTQTQADSRYMLNTNSFVAGKNYLINGGFDIWQRGTSSTNAGVQYLADRWKTQFGSNAGVVQQVTSSTSPASISGFQYSLNATANGSNAFFQMGQQIEYANCSYLQGKTVTLSFYARANNTNTFSTNIFAAYRTLAEVDSTATLFQSSGYFANAVTLTTTNERYSYTMTLPQTFGSLSIEFNSQSATSASGDGFTITGIQLEIGQNVTNFSRAGGTIQGELANCQRYFEILNATNQNDWVGDYYSTTNCYAPIFWKVTKRTAPALTLPAASSFIVWNNGSGLTPSAVGTDSLLLNGGSIYTVTSARTSGTAARLRIISPNTISVSAEF